MATIFDMVGARLPDEAALFEDSLDIIIEEATALAGLEGTAETGMSTLQKSLVADMAAKALLLPAMSHYKKALAKAAGDGAGTAEFADKLAFLRQMEAKLDAAIGKKTGLLDEAADTGVPLVTVNEE